MSKMKRTMAFILALAMVIPIVGMLLPNISNADAMEDDRVVVLGKNLNQSQRNQMINFFGAASDVKTIEVTNQEERKYLGNYIEERQLGTRAISSAYVERLPEGKGIQVESHNITWVTNDMYRNALVTAGVTDAKVVIASPVKVSGTAALTGIIKAFENISGSNISEKEKQVASEEIARTATLGNDIGQDKAEDLMSTVKMHVVENKVKDPAQIKEAVEESAKELNITLTEEQKQQITDLMKRISSLDLNVDNIKNQIGDIVSKLDKLTIQNDEIKGILGRIFESISNFFSKLFN